MILETAQLLSSAHIVLDNRTKINNTDLYKLTHKNHPCAIWVRSSIENYKWLYQLFVELCDEYTYRYSKKHLCDTKMREVLSYIPDNIPDIPMTAFALAMPDECKTDDPVESYRNYYRSHKRHLCEWKNRSVPDWYNPVPDPVPDPVHDPVPEL
jgi:hypothetical protein